VTEYFDPCLHAVLVGVKDGSFLLSARVEIGYFSRMRESDKIAAVFAVAGLPPTSISARVRRTF
jgi:hypothetical protein